MVIRVASAAIKNNKLLSNRKHFEMKFLKNLLFVAESKIEIENKKINTT